MSINKELATLFDHMADLFLLGGRDEDRYRIASYRRVAQMLKYSDKDLKKLAEEKKLTDLPGVGETIAQKIQEYLSTGTIKAYENLRGSFPEGIMELMDVPSLGPKKVQQLWKDLGVTDRESLIKVLKDGSAEALPRFGKKTVENILQGLEMEGLLKKRKLLGQMIPLVEELQQYLKASKLTEKLSPAGSFRRKEETIGDIDLLAVSKKPAELIHYFVSHPETKKILAEGDTKGSIVLEGDQQVDLRVVAADQWGAALQYFTGSKEHNIHLRTVAKTKDLMINEYGVFQLKNDGTKGKKIAGATEEEVYIALGLQYIAPEMRTDTGEIEAAQSKKKLPQLVGVSDLKGDLHTHTKYSDGVNTIEEMAKKADELGLEYLALTDHSPGLIVANGVKIEDIPKKIKELKEIQKKVKVKLLMGAEVDILADGKLDYPPEILEQLDVVVASIHSGFRREDNTERLLKAMENPYVTIIGHISGRLIGSREGYVLDYERIFQKAVETNTWIEINAQPTRQDIPWNRIRAGKEKGVQFVIDTDSHTRDSLWMRELGVSIARRGWLTKGDIMNTLSLPEFLKALSTQRKDKLKKFTKSV